MRLIFLLLLAVAGCGNPTAETPAPVPAFETPTPLGAPIAAKLYRAEFSNGSWAEPQSLGAPVNIPGGFGGPDLWWSVRQFDHKGSDPSLTTAGDMFLIGVGPDQSNGPHADPFVARGRPAI